MFALLAGVASGAASPAGRRVASSNPVTVRIVVVGLQSDPSRALQLNFTGGFTAIERVSAVVAPGDPGIGQFTWQGDQLRIGAQSGTSEIELQLQFALSRPGSPILGDEQAPDATIVDAQLPGGQPLLIKGAFTIPTSAGRGGSRHTTLAIFPRLVRSGARVTLAGNVGDRCVKGASVTLSSPAFVHRHRLGGARAVETVVMPGGGFLARTTVSRRAVPGRYQITARCGGRKLDIVAHLRVRG